jgi:hypothetical protein
MWFKANSSHKEPEQAKRVLFCSPCGARLLLFPPFGGEVCHLQACRPCAKQNSSQLEPSTDGSRAGLTSWQHASHIKLIAFAINRFAVYKAVGFACWPAWIGLTAGQLCWQAGIDTPPYPPKGGYNRKSLPKGRQG